MNAMPQMLRSFARLGSISFAKRFIQRMDGMFDL